MALPDSWVESLFARLTVRYGVAFTRQWADIDVEVIKGDWAEVLAGMSGEAIKGALDMLPPDRPPNAAQFRRLCLDAMPSDDRRVFKALPAPVEPMPEGVRDKLESLRKRMTTMQRVA